MRPRSTTPLAVSLGTACPVVAPRYRVPVRVFVFGAARVEGCPEAPATSHPVDIGARKPRSIVSALAMTPGRPVSPGLLADLVWAGDPPPAAHGALHAYISGLRKALEPDRRARAAASVLETTDHGYLVKIDADAVDVHRFAADVRAGERGLAPLASQVGDGDRSGWPTGRRRSPSSSSSTRPWPPGRANRTPTCPTTPTSWRSAPRSNGSGSPRRRPGSSACSRWASTPASSRRRSRRSRASRCASGFGRSTPSRCCGPVARSRRSTRSAASASCSPRTPASTRAPSWRGLEQAILRQDPALTVRLAGAARGPHSPATAPPLHPTAPDIGRTAPRAELRAVLDRLAEGSPRPGDGDRGAGDRQVLAGPSPRRRGPGEGGMRRRRRLLAGRRRAAVVALAGRPARSRGRHRGRPGRRGVALADVISAEAGALGPGQLAFQTWDRIARAVLGGGPAPPRPRRPRRPALGGRGDPARAAAPRRGRRRTTCPSPSWRPVVATPSRRGPSPTSPRRSPGGRPCGSS